MMMDRSPVPAGPRSRPTMAAREAMAQSLPPQRTPFGWWSALTVPRMTEAMLRDPRSRERYRRAQLASVVIPVLLLMMLTQLKNAFVNTPTLIGLAVLFAACVLGMILNRAGAITTAGTLMTGALVVTLVASLIGAASLDHPPGLSLIWLPVFQVMTLAVIIGGLLLPRWMTFVTAFVTSVVSTLLIVYEPRAQDLSAFISQNGYAPVVLRIYAEQWIAAILVFMLARSIERAVARADRAEDLARAEAQIAQQAQFIAEQNARLEYGIQQLLETHRRIAAGDFSVRTPTQQDNELWQIGVSLNNLISRFGRLANAERRLITTEESLRGLAMQIDIARRGGQPTWPPLSGTVADQIMQAMGVAPSPAAWRPPPYAETAPGYDGPSDDPPALPGSGMGPPRSSGSWTDPIE